MTFPLCRRLSAVAMVASLVACGGGGGERNDSGTAGTSTSTPATNTPTTTPGTATNSSGNTAQPTAPSSPSQPAPSQPAPSQPGTSIGPVPLALAAPMTMSCVEGADHQCSGDSIYRRDNGIALTRSGVQALAVSTNDLAESNPYKTTAFGMLRSATGIAEIRLAKDGSGAASAAMLLNDLGLSWDGTTPRPPIIETFRTTQGRIGINGNGTLSVATLPDPSDLAFYDYATRTFSATQARYANNVYFPRLDNPSRCGPDVNPCPTSETSGFHRRSGSWRTGGREPDALGAVRLHEDGDIHAGNDLPGSDGSVTILPGGNGVGVPFPGSKGYRSFSNWGYRYANLGTWLTQDTVLIEEWAAMGNEHNKNRRGVVAFGDVTPTGAVAASGTATYSGIIYGWYTPSAAQEPSVFRGNAVVTVDFASQRVTLSFTDTSTYDEASAPVPAVVLTTTAWNGAPGTNVANYFTSAVDVNGMQGGISGRYFGPAAAGTASGAPEEVGGVLSLAGSSAIIMGGFIGRRQ